MDAQWKTKWVEALRSGNYEQGKDSLREGGWAEVSHNTRTLDCMGGDHGACVLPEHCRCACHGGER